MHVWRIPFETERSRSLDSERMNNTALDHRHHGWHRRETARALLATRLDGARAASRSRARKPHGARPGRHRMGPRRRDEPGRGRRAAAAGASVIVHGANPPGYRNWKGLALPMLESTIAAARAAGARIVFPGTVYNFGPDALPARRRVRAAASDDAQGRDPRRDGAAPCGGRARRRAGARRARRRLLRAARGEQLVQPGARQAGPRRLRSVTYPGTRDVGHAWAYLPDVAETIARLLERAAGPPAVRGVPLRRALVRARHRDRRGDARAWAASARRAIRRFPWFAVYLLAPFVETFREMLEMRYLWQRAAPARQPQARRLPRQRAAHAARRRAGATRSAASAFARQDQRGSGRVYQYAHEMSTSWSGRRAHNSHGATAVFPSGR